MTSTTARIGWGTLVLLALVGVGIYLLPLVWPVDALGAGAEALGLLAMAVGGGGGIAAAGHGIRHLGSRAPTSAQLAQAAPPITEGEA